VVVVRPQVRAHARFCRTARLSPRGLDLPYEEVLGVLMSMMGDAEQRWKFGPAFMVSLEDGCEGAFLKRRD
jgi:hypothetical protein